jgi:hypothetical protein
VRNSLYEVFPSEEPLWLGMTVRRSEQHCLRLHALKAQRVTRATFLYKTVI